MNERKLKKFAASRECLVLLFKHDFIVLTRGKQNAKRCHKGDEKKSWERWLNLMEAEAHFFFRIREDGKKREGARHPGLSP